MLPGVDFEPPEISDVDQDTVFDGFTDFVLGNPRGVAAGIVVVMLMMMWKRPLWRGILLGALGIIIIMFVVAN